MAIRAGRPTFSTVHVPILSGPILSEQSCLTEQTGHLPIYGPRPHRQASFPEGGHDPEPRAHPGKKAAKGFPHPSTTPNAEDRLAHLAPHGNPHLGGLSGPLHKEQPHQLAMGSTAGAEYEVELPSPLQAESPGKSESSFAVIRGFALRFAGHGKLDGEALAALAAPVAQDVAAAGGSGTLQKAHGTLPGNVVRLIRPFHW